MLNGEILRERERERVREREWLWERERERERERAREREREIEREREGETERARERERERERSVVRFLQKWLGEFSEARRGFLLSCERTRSWHITCLLTSPGAASGTRVPAKKAFLILINLGEDSQTCHSCLLWRTRATAMTTHRQTPDVILTSHWQQTEDDINTHFWGT